MAKNTNELIADYYHWAPVLDATPMGEFALATKSKGTDHHISRRRARTILKWRANGVPYDAATPAPATETKAVQAPSGKGEQPTTFRLVEIPEDAEAEEPIEDLIARQVATFKRASAKDRTIGERVVALPEDLPIAIVHFGDPHLDDDGCDWPALLSAVEVVQNTEGMYGGNIGDTVNNWVGRLVAKYADQHATEDEGWRMARWLMTSIGWIYIVGGNHDCWRGGFATLKALRQGASVGLLAPDECRIVLRWPDGSEYKVHARHDFKGHSQWNAMHGLMKAAKMDGWGDLYIAGHRHTWGLATEENVDGRIRTGIRLRGFKYFDDYARRLGFHEQQQGQTVTTIIDPHAKHPAMRCRTYLDPEEAAAVLTWLRGRRKAAK